MASMKTTFPLALIFLLLQTEFISLEAIWSNSSAGNSTVGCIEMERGALLKFKEGLHDPSRTLSSWVGEDCCNWLGVGCSNRTGNIITLELNGQLLCDQMSGYTSTECWEPLSGVLSPSLLELKYLNYFDLSYNDFQGIPIPNFIGSLNKLTYLNLSYASFAGMIPPHLGNLSNLLYLDLSANYPQVLTSNLNWLSGLSSLKYLSLNGVNLSEETTNWLQTVNLPPSLLELQLSFCQFNYLTQNFPSVNFTSLSELDLSANVFSSSIPQWVFNFTSLTNLQLSYCYLTGSIPKIAKGNLCKLQTLALSDNNLSAEITEFFQALSECNSKVFVLDLRVVHVRDLNFLLRSEIFVHMDRQLRALYLILGCTLVYMTWQPFSQALSVDNPLLSYINVRHANFLPPSLTTGEARDFGPHYITVEDLALVRDELAERVSRALTEQGHIPVEGNEGQA
nr:receptor-like protein EIX1 [Quercus suber]